MKYISILSIGLLTTIVASTTLVSCSEDTMDSINNDINHTVDVPAKFILADVITSTAFSNVGGDLNTYFSTFVEHEVGVHNQLFRAEMRAGEPSSSSTYNNTWANLYKTLKNARIIIDKTSEGGSQEGNNTTKGIANVLVALNSAIIADSYGDAPYSQAALPNLVDGKPAFMTPVIDKQETIYAEIFKNLDEAITDIPKGDKHLSGGSASHDFIYGVPSQNSVKEEERQNLWVKLAYGLKARYTMRLLNRSTDKTADLLKVIEFADKSFASASEQAAYSVYDSNNLNPLFDFQWSRDGISASQSMVDKLLERNDPRFPRVFVDVKLEKGEKWSLISSKDSANYDPAPNGENEEKQYYYNTSVFVFSQTAPTYLLSYHEVLFLKAEALARLNKQAARTVLREAVIAGIANAEVSIGAALSAPIIVSSASGPIIETSEEITLDDAAKYFDNDVKPLFETNPLKEVMVQKYIALWGANGESQEIYSDIRRMKALGEDFVELKNKKKFPLRATYGVDDTTTNPEVNTAYGDGQYVYTENVWWAGGTR